MAINRVAVQTIIKNIPTELRNAARKERKVIINETKKDPIAASFMAAKGELSYVSNNILKAKLAELNKKLAAEAYAETNQFVHRQPMGNVAQQVKPDVVKASSYLNN